MMVDYSNSKPLWILSSCQSFTDPTVLVVGLCVLTHVMWWMQYFIHLKLQMPKCKDNLTFEIELRIFRFSWNYKHTNSNSWKNYWNHPREWFSTSLVRDFFKYSSRSSIVIFLFFSFGVTICSLFLPLLMFY